jgi:hypothetical protein
MSDRFHWMKKGLVYAPCIPEFSFGSHPTIIHVKDDLHVTAFTCRDANQRSHIFLSYAEVQGGEIRLIGQPKLALRPGDYGFFDCDGVISGCLIRDREQVYLYFVGWQNLPDSLWICDTGRAVLDVDSLTLEKEFLGPVFGRDKHHPLFAAATAFYITDDDVWHTWYNSGIKWERTKNGWHHYYGLHHASSQDGIDWNRDPGFVIPFADKYEYAFGRPSVVKWGDTFHMWFAHRATKQIKTYRIGYANSKDGLNWDRDDSLSGIDVSNEGWDSEMICYPYVFTHDGISYMLYNGNSYGKTGFGVAVLEDNEN